MYSKLKGIKNSDVKTYINKLVSKIFAMRYKIPTDETDPSRLFSVNENFCYLILRIQLQVDEDTGWWTLT